MKHCAATLRLPVELVRRIDRLSLALAHANEDAPKAPSRNTTIIDLLEMAIPAAEASWMGEATPTPKAPSVSPQGPSKEDLVSLFEDEGLRDLAASFDFGISDPGRKDPKSPATHRPHKGKR